MLLVEDLELARMAALKEITAAPEHLEAYLRRFLREARVLARTRHPNLIEIYDVFPEAVPPFLVLELVEGVELYESIPRGVGLGPAVATRLARELSGALAALHAAGVVHRDVKTRNVMLRERDGSAVLMDLGLALDLERTRITGTGVVLGTPRYFPPEMVAGEPVGEAADWYQLGALLFEVLTGEPLVPGRSWGEVEANLRSGSYRPIPTGTPHGLASAIRGLTRVAPEQRLASRPELLALLDPGLVERSGRRVGRASSFLPSPGGGRGAGGLALCLALGVVLGRGLAPSVPADPPLLQPGASSPLSPVFELGPGHSLRVRAERPCRLRLLGEVAWTAHLLPGRHDLALAGPLPAAGWTLEVGEGDGLRTQAVPLAAAVERLERADEGAVERRREWRAPVLTSGLPVPLRRAFWGRWVRDLAWLHGRALDGHPEGLAAPGPTGAGAITYSMEAPDTSTGLWVPLTSDPGRGDRGDFVLRTPVARLLPNPAYDRAAEVLHFTWPDGPPRDRRPVTLALHASRLPCVFGFRFTTGAPGQEAPLATLWHPDPTDPEHRSFEDWIRLELPGDLWPDPGQPVALTLVALRPPADNHARVRALRLSWAPAAAGP